MGYILRIVKPIYKWTKVPINKAKKVSVRFTDTEYKELEAKANKDNITISEYIRRSSIKGYYSNKLKMNHTMELLSSVNKIGINLNQIAKYINTNRSIDKIVLSYLIAIEKSLQKVLK